MNKILSPRRLIPDPEPWCRSWIGSDEGEALDFSLLESGGTGQHISISEKQNGFQ